MDDTNIYEYVGKRIRSFRIIKAISQEILANALGVTTNTISRWETATYKPSLENIYELAQFFGVSVLDFLPKTEEEVRKPIDALLERARWLPDKDVLQLTDYAEWRIHRYRQKDKEQS